MPPASAGALLALLAALGFSLKAIFVKLAYAHGVGAATLLALRLLFALPVFLVVGVRASQGQEKLDGRQKALLIVVGLLGYYAASILDFLGLRYISAGLERLILFSYPTLTVLLGVLFQGKKITGREGAAMLLCYAGIALAFARDLGLSADTSGLWIGAAFVFGSSLCYALYLTGSASMIPRLGAARFTALSMLVSTAATLLHFSLTEPPGRLLSQPWQVYAFAAAMAFFSTLPIFLQSAAIRLLGAGRVALIGTLGPMITIVFGWWWLGEPVSAGQLGGMALVVAGVVLISRAH